MNTLPVPGFCGSNMQIPRENWESRARQIAWRPSYALVPDWRYKRGILAGSRDESIPGPTARPSRLRSRTTGHQYRTPGYIRPFVGPTGFPDFGRRGWTNQADRLPWRPYGLIRANIISEDARKNRRISENSFSQRSLAYFFLPSVSSSSRIPVLSVRGAPREPKKISCFVF